MSITSSVLKTLKKHVAFEYCGETVNVEYYPAALGDDSMAQARKLNAQMQAAMSADDEQAIADTSRAIAAWVCTWLAGWDYMLDDNSAPQPITTDNILTQMSTFSDFMQTISRVVMEHKTQGNVSAPDASPSSGAISQPMEHSATITESPTPLESSSPQDGLTEPPVSNG